MIAAYQGVPGAFSEEAARALMGDDATLRPCPTLDDVRHVHSHPVALNQCRRFIAAHRLSPVAAFDTAGAVAALMNGGDSDSAAIASRRAATLHGGVVIAERIQDQPENWTRFLRLVPAAAAPPRHGANAIVTFRLRHQPGSLCRALQVLADDGLNLTKIESRPLPDRPFEYAFLIELTASSRRTDWSALLTPLAAATVDARLVAAYDVVK